MLVETMLDLHKKLPAANLSSVVSAKEETPDEKTRLEREISATDREIDQLVYELYELTDEEIKIAEGKTG